MGEDGGWTQTTATAPHPFGRPSLRLVDLDTGASRPVEGVEVQRVYRGSGMVWSPDGAWLIAVDSGNQVVAIDPDSLDVRDLGVNLSEHGRIAIRQSQD